ncbi:GtrA family protein [Clostridium cellulovorans]|nr:GtrA family protein [Clostridium cellulovorans]
MMKFALVGVSNTAISLIVYNILVVLGVNYMLANIIGYCVGVINSFIWNKNWVFKSNENSSAIIFKFVAVNILTLVVTTMFLYIFVDILGYSKFISQIFSTVVGMGINYLLNKIWTFKEVK